jgi:hypothetical protein
MRKAILILIIMLLPATLYAVDNPLNTGPIRGGNLGEGNPYTLGVKAIAAAPATGDVLLLETDDALLLENDDNFLME